MEEKPNEGRSNTSLYRDIHTLVGIVLAIVVKDNSNVASLKKGGLYSIPAVNTRRESNFGTTKPRKTQLKPDLQLATSVSVQPRHRIFRMDWVNTRIARGITEQQCGKCLAWLPQSTQFRPLTGTQRKGTRRCLQCRKYDLEHVEAQTPQEADVPAMGGASNTGGDRMRFAEISGAIYVSLFAQ